MTKEIFKAEELYEHGLFFFNEARNADIALPFFFAAAAAGCEMAWSEIGQIIEYETADSDRAEKWFRKLESAGCLSPIGVYRLGMIAYWDRGDVEQALKYLVEAADSGVEDSFQALGYIFHNEKGDICGADAWYEKAASAQCLIGPYLEDYEKLINFEDC